MPLILLSGDEFMAAILVPCRLKVVQNVEEAPAASEAQAPGWADSRNRTQVGLITSIPRP